MSDYQYRLIDPVAIERSSLMPLPGSRRDCLRDGLLDIIHVGLDSGMTYDDVDEALAQVVDHVARANRERFKVHRVGKSG